MSKYSEKRKGNKSKAEKKQLIKRVVSGVATLGLFVISVIVRKKPRV